MAEAAARVGVSRLNTEPYPAFSRALEASRVHPTAVVAGSARVDPSCAIMAKAVVDEDVQLGPNVVVGPGVYVGAGCTLEAEVILGPNVVVREHTHIGARTRVESGAVIGSDGFGFASCESGTRHKIPQIGRVVIQEDVVIGANTTVDRATLGTTVIQKGVRIGALVQVGHNVIIGAGARVDHQTGICGSTKIGEQAEIGSQVGIVGHLEIGPGALVYPGAGITRALRAHEAYAGMPVCEVQDYERLEALRTHLPELYDRVSAIEQSLNGKAHPGSSS